jgi:hypothetical protein
MKGKPSHSLTRLTRALPDVPEILLSRPAGPLSPPEFQRRLQALLDYLNIQETDDGSELSSRLALELAALVFSRPE